MTEKDAVQGSSRRYPEHRVIQPSVLYFGTPVAIVSTVNPDRTPNLTPMSSLWSLGDRLVLGMASAGQGCRNAVREGECVINLAPAQLWEKVERLARMTGRNPVPEYKSAAGYFYEPRKFEVAGLTPLPSHLVRAPRVAECPLQIEAEVVIAHAPGGGTWREDAQHAFAIIEARALRVHVHDAITVPGTHRIDVSRWQPLLYVFRHYVASGAELGRTFKAER